jgi:pyridoxal/pyridoxine/pyridoxamine kinase
MIKAIFWMLIGALLATLTPLELKHLSDKSIETVHSGFVATEKIVKDPVVIDSVSKKAGKMKDAVMDSDHN